MKYVGRAADCSIRIFMACRFDNNLQALVIDGEPPLNELEIAWQTILIEYLDASGNNPEELKHIRPVYAKKCRNRCVELCFLTVNGMLDMFNEPFPDALPLLKQNGHNIRWNGDIDDYKKQVKQSAIREITHSVKLDELESELKKFQELQAKTSPSADNELTLFYRLLNSLEASGYKIDEDKTNVARFAIMVKDYTAALSRQGTN
jgi:hypothetical protein